MMTSVMEGEGESKYKMINFEETELRLGLPGASANDHGESALKSSSCASTTGKRGFSQTHTTTTVDLKLNLSSSSSNNDSSVAVDNSKENTAIAAAAAAATPTSHPPPPPPANDPAKPPSKAQVVGWPPVRSFRKNIVNVQRNNNNNNDEVGKANSTTTATTSATTNNGGNCAVAFVKVSMDGAPYLRKVDLKMYKCYQELSDALAKMFSSFTVNAKCGSQGSMKDFMNESKLIDLLNDAEYVPTYEDKDGDWMLVGDVPWKMFVESCKRLRIMKGSEAIGLAPRAVAKYKNRS